MSILWITLLSEKYDANLQNGPNSCFIFFFFYMRDRAHKLSSKLFTEVKLESCSLTAIDNTEGNPEDKVLQPKISPSGGH